MRLLRDLFHKVTAVVHVEPRLYDVKRLRPDLDILLSNQALMLDVAVTHPGAPSRKSPKPLAAATDMEHTKNREYRTWAAERGRKFLPFVLESHGAFGKAAEEVLKTLTKAATTEATSLGMSPKEFSALARKALSAALQRGNGLVAKMGALQARATHAAIERAGPA